MDDGHGGHMRRRKRLLRVAPLARSHSLDSISPISPGQQGGGSGIPTGKQHLPPLGRIDGRSSSVTSTVQRQLSQGRSRHGLGRSSSSPVPVPDDISSAEATIFPETGWTAFADLFVQAGQTAGIVFRWMEKISAAAGAGATAGAVVAGLVVVEVAEGSLASRHGGISPGMVLIEVNRKRFAGMSQDQVMHVMRVVASQPRVLTLARVRTPPPPSPSPGARGSSTTNAEFRSQGTTPTLPVTRSSGVYGSAGDGGGQHRASSAATVQRPSSGESSQPYSRPQSSKSSFADSDCGEGASIGSSNSARLSLFCMENDERQGSDGPSLSAASRNTSHHRHRQLPSSSSPQTTIALRFVGSRGDMSIFDRDHVLGLKTRDIEFLPLSNRMGGKESPSLTAAAQHHRTNSKRSLQDLTRDWRNDPFSTPARRRRLINDACKVIFRSYTHAAVRRVAELRREESSAVVIQAAFRMKSAQRLFLEKLSARRQEAASILQLGWLSCLARRRMRVLRDQRDHNRRVEEDKRNKREAHERRERHRREAEERERERERKERENRRRREQSLVVFLQRWFRARQEERRRRKQERLRLERLREEDLLRAVTLVQAVIRRRQQRLRRETKATQQIARENKASARLQRTWRRYKAERRPDGQGRRRSERPNVSSLSSNKHVAQDKTVRAFPGSRPLPNTKGAPLRSPKKENQIPPDDMGASANNGERLSWESLSSALGVNPSLAAEIAREGEEGAAADSTRPWTAAAAVETSASTSSLRHPNHPTPPAGMMTVTVRRGSEETSLVTPIVLTESGQEEVGATTTSSVVAASARDGVEVAAGSPGLDNGNEDGKSRRLAEQLSPGASDGESKASSVRNGGGAAMSAVHANGPSLNMEVTGGPENNLNAHKSAEASPHPTSKLGSGKSGAGSASLPLPASTVLRVNNYRENTPNPPPGQTTASESRSPGAGAIAAASESVEGVSRTVVKPQEQLFMEDTQVYLGCAVCGVKYLVEAVDPEQSNLAQGQPAPEVLYLCTTCGGALRNNGEDGRWRRRRRPSSAPAAGRRRGGTSSFGGGGGSASGTESSVFRRSVHEGWNGNEPATDGVSPEGGEHTRPFLPVEGEGSRGGNASTARLRYAHCARKIQHAYRDFRHRQYLRDWAFSLLRRWLLHRVQSWKRANLRLVRRLAAVTLQSAARAAAARARCSALRAARLRLWTGRVAALCADAPGVGDRAGEYPPSPAAIDLFRETSVPPPLPPPARGASSLPSSANFSAAGAAPREGGVNNGSGARKGRALAEALAPRMGQPPPGCPAALDVDWGEWGVGFRVMFPPSPRVG